MFKTLFKLFKVSLLALTSLGMAGCSKAGVTDISNLDYGFCEASKISDDSQLDLSNPLIKKPTEFEVQENYYFLLNVTAITNKTSKEQALINLNLHFGSSELIDGSLYKSDAPGNKELIKDQDTGLDSVGFSVPIKTPNVENEIIEIKIVLKLLTKAAGETNFSCEFSSENTELVGNNINGLQKSISIKKWKLAAPTIAYSTTQLVLSWKHVYKAEYYCLYIDGVAGPNYNVPDNYAVDTTINWDLTEVTSLYGHHRIRLQSCHTSANFTLSELSNEVEVSL